MLKCNVCGRFISYQDKDAVTYTSYGGCGFLEPPDPEFVCGKCWVGMDERDKNLVKITSWIKPTRIA